MEENLTSVYKDASEVKAIVDKELDQYEQTKDELSQLKRQNLVLFKYIKKLIRRQKRERMREKRKEQRKKQLERERREAELQNDLSATDDLDN